MSAARMTSLGSSPSHTRLQGGGRGAGRASGPPPPCARAASGLARARAAAPSAPRPAAAPRGARAPRLAARVAAGVGAGAAGDDPHLPSTDQWDARKTQALMQLARVHNLLPSFLLVMVGAWAGSGRSLAVLGSPGVWLMSLLSGGIAVSSCVFNDYFDVSVDRTNAPHKPLASGAVPLDAALLLSSSVYCAVLIVACFMEPSQLRSIVALSALATLLYTPVFKKLTAIKNATVATVIALAPLGGALAAGAGDLGVRRLLPATLFAFAGVMFREIVMDLTDEEGDRATGIKTLPVRIGKAGALACALGCVAAGAAGALWAASAWGPIAAPAAVVALCSARLAQLAFGICKSGFEPAVMTSAIEECLKPVGLCLILLSALAP